MNTFKIILYHPDDAWRWQPFVGLERLPGSAIWGYMNTRDLFINGVRADSVGQWWTPAQFVLWQMREHLRLRQHVIKRTRILLESRKKAN